MSESPRKNGSGLVKLVILSDGSEIDETYRVISVSILKKVNAIPFAKIILHDGDLAEADFPASNSDTFKPGAEIEIKAGYDQDDESVFKGIVVKHGLKISGDNNTTLVIECRDKAVKMTIGRNNANFVDSKDSDLISTLIGNHSGLSADVDASDTEYKELVQYYCTDWDFMMSRAEVNGRIVIVEDATVSVKKPETSASPELKVTYGADLMDFNAEIDARTQLKAVKGVAWDPKTQEAVEQDGASASLNKQGDLSSDDLSTVVSPDSFRLQSPVPIEKTGLKAWADAQLLKAGMSMIKGSMRFQGSAKAKHGGLIELDGVGNRFNGNVFIASVRHDIADGNWLTEVEFGLSDAWFSEQKDIAAPPASGFLPGVEGLQIGVVKKLDEDPEGEQKIQVSVPVMQAETEGVWARLANFYGSAGIGSFFIPEIGDEVVLGYLNNDPCHPIILGSLYSSKNAPPYELTADNFIKAIVTKSELKIEFDDEKMITTIETPGGNKVVLNDDETSILLSDQNGNTLTLDDSGIALDSPKDISITATGKVTIDATGELGLTSKADVKAAGMNIDCEADVGFTGKGSASAEVSASGQLTLKGATVMIN